MSFIYLIVDNKMFLLSLGLRDRCPYIDIIPVGFLDDSGVFFANFQ